MSDVNEFRLDRVYFVPGSIKPYELVRREGKHLTFKVMDTNPGFPRIVEADSYIYRDCETVRFDDGIVLSTGVVPHISIDNLDLFKGFVKEGFWLGAIEVTYGTLELAVPVEIGGCYGEHGNFAVKVARLFAFFDDCKDYRLVKIWTDAYDENYLLEVFPDLFDTADPSLLTYDFDEFCAVIDHWLSPEGMEERRPGVSSYDLPF